jgi:hypothetical protein
MVRQLKQAGFKVMSWALLLALVVGVVTLFQPAPAQAHCDSVNGPVVNAESGDVKIVLPYVQPEYEAELVAAFQHTLEVRSLGPEARELADHFFFETAVRLHRMGEGAAYTGLKTETDHGPALAAAGQALETGSLEEVQTLLVQALQEGVAEKFEVVESARLEATRQGTVAADRERAEAELMFEKYVYELYNAALGQMVHAEANNAHQH